MRKKRRRNESILKYILASAVAVGGLGLVAPSTPASSSEFQNAEDIHSGVVKQVVKTDKKDNQAPLPALSDFAQKIMMENDTLRNQNERSVFC